MAIYGNMSLIVISFSFTLDNLYNSRQYLLNLNISQCYEADCAVTHVVLTNSLLSKPVCDWSMDYLIKSRLAHI